MILRIFTLCGVILFCQNSAITQDYTLKGKITDEAGAGISFATIVIKSALDSTMIKADITAEDGSYFFEKIPQGRYFAEASFVGLRTFQTSHFDLSKSDYYLKDIVLTADSELIEEVIVSAQRALIEVKADRTVFNVQGTINSAGDNGLNLLRKAPGVLVDNNNNISVLGRAGVLLYVDGKRVPLTGDDLTNYLQNLTSEQIDKIDIITNPGARYEAQGNAGIIDIQLKKDKNLGSNGALSTTYGHGRYGQGNINANGNYRNKFMNTFANLGYNAGSRWNQMIFDTYQNNVRLYEVNRSVNDYQGFNGRWGTDFFIKKNHTLGFLVSAQTNKSNSISSNKANIYSRSTPTLIDSILSAPNTSEAIRNQATFNVNYAYESGKNKINIDIDHGVFNNEAENFQPNFYKDPSETRLISSHITSYNTPVKIAISTLKGDFDTEVLGGNLGLGAKFSKVATDNTFSFYDINNGLAARNDRRSNQFKYDENVLAGYANYKRAIYTKWKASAGMRVENTDATGELIAYLAELEEAPAEFKYTSFFPSAGLSYEHTSEHVYSLNYGRRINRPDYNVLNPFREQLSELSYSKGNKFLQPEIVNNIEISYTLKYRYAFKLAYSNTTNKITRLLGPDEIDPRAGFISWDNLATQKLYSFNASLPVEVTKWWNAYMNFTVAYTDNQANYGDGKVVDIQAGSYNIFQQHTFSLGKKWKGEISGWYSGPGVWGGVFLYDPSYSLDLGLQRKFINDKMNVRISLSDITYQTGWSGVSNYNGQTASGGGNWDSRRGSISISYDLGNSNVKTRKRSTGIESESNRVQ